MYQPFLQVPLFLLKKTGVNTKPGINRVGIQFMFWGLSVGRGIDCVVVFNNFPINCTIRSRSQFSDCRKMCFTIKGKRNNNIEATIFAEENTP